jgi:hypothetical protein
MDNPLKPIVEIIVSDGSENPKINVLSTNDGIAWCFLLKLGTSRYAYNFKNMEFQSISPIEYKNLLSSCHCVELKTNQSKRNEWIEIPISEPHPARRVFDSVIPR